MEIRITIAQEHPSVKTMPDKYSVLIVEDNDHVRNTLVSWLSLSFSNCEISSTNSGEEALLHFETSKPNIILMDIGLPGISGLEAMRRIKETAPETVIIIISIHETHEYRTEAEMGGALAFLPKHRMYTELNPLLKEALEILANRPSQTGIA